MLRGGNRLINLKNFVFRLVSAIFFLLNSLYTEPLDARGVALFGTTLKNALKCIAKFLNVLVWSIQRTNALKTSVKE